MPDKKAYSTNRISLLEPEGEHSYFSIGENTANDLSIDFISESISENSTEQTVIKNILLRMPVSEKVISYRRAVYSELRENGELCEKLYYIFDSMRFHFNDRPAQIGNGSTIYDLLSRFRSLESYINSVLMIKEAIEGHEFSSEGLRRFSEYVKELYSSSGFDALAEDISAVGDDISNIRSMTLGVNLNADFYPKEVGIISLNQYRFDEQSVLRRFIKYHNKDQVIDKDLLAFSMEMHHDSLNKSSKKFAPFLAVKDQMAYFTADFTASDSPLMNNLNLIIERMLPSTTAKLKKLLARYVDVSGKALAELADEMLFYLRFIELEKKITELGLPCCCGNNSADDTVFRDFYNVKLAICRINGTVDEDIVCNDLEFTPERTVHILTGPNRGGKTILTQGIGLAFLLYQSGVFTPAASAEIRPCNGIYTHFPVDEERTVSLGRLGEEAQRFNEICRTADRDSLLLFNESFATTSHTESLYIAEDVLRYLCCTGSRTCFNTHMHELAENADKFGNTENAVCKAVSVVMENENGKRSYRISYKKPDGKSYAHEIAYKYGITFEQLSENLKK